MTAALLIQHMTYKSDGCRCSSPFVLTLRVSTDELLGLEEGKKLASKTPSRRVLRRLEKIEKLPKRDQDALLRTIDAFLSKSA